MARDLKIDMLWITDAEKRVVYKTHSKKQGEIKNIEPVNNALAGKNSIHMSKGSLGWGIRSYGPIEWYGKVIGTVMAGTRINDAFAKKISRVINTNILVGMTNNVIASSIYEGKGVMKERVSALTLLPWQGVSGKERLFVKTGQWNSKLSFISPSKYLIKQSAQLLKWTPV